MGRSPCSEEPGLKKGPWTSEEDEKLVKYIKKHGHGSWRALPKLAGLNRCGKSCRLRWTNYLRPDIKRGKFSQDEEQTILHLHSMLGNKWSAIASHLPGRTDNEIKNFWNTHMRKKLLQIGFDPMTHKPRTDIFASLPHLVALASLNKLIDNQPVEEQALRLQAEALQLDNLQYLQCLLQTHPQASLPTTIFSDMETCNLLNSLATYKDSPISSTNNLPHLDLTHTLQVQGINDSIPFSHLPELQAPCSYQTPPLSKDNLVQQVGSHDQFTVFTQDDDYSLRGNSSWLPQYSPVNNLGENSSTSSYGGEANSVVWPPEFLVEDPLFHEIA